MFLVGLQDDYYFVEQDLRISAFLATETYCEEILNDKLEGWQVNQWVRGVFDRISNALYEILEF